MYILINSGKSSGGAGGNGDDDIQQLTAMSEAKCRHACGNIKNLWLLFRFATLMICSRLCCVHNKKRVKT